VILDKLAARVDDKSVCDIFVKIFNEILNQSNLVSVPGVAA